MSDKLITLSDRIKELSRSTGTGNLRLDGAVTGFDSFGNTYSYNDLVFYAVTDGTDYEVGSGQYILDGGNNALRRFPVVSSNSNSAVNFSAGIKEVYVTYPGKFAVFTASGLNGFVQPDVSGVAFWGGSQALNYSQDIVWDNNNSRLGIKQPSPQFSIDVGGLESYSAINISGVIVGDSGVMFSGVDPSYSGGRQLEPFLRNQLDATTGTEDVFSLSGLVDQRLLFKQQNAGLVFAGPPSGCTPPATCSPDYPSFRALTLADLPNLSDTYVTATGTGGSAGRVAFYHSSGVIDSDAYFYWDNVNNFLGVNQNSPAYNLDVSGNARITSNFVVGGDITVTGDINATQIVFGDSSVISGAYHAGSGLELHNGIEFNIGNLFNVADNTATSGWIHQGDVLAISGVSGIFTDYHTNSNVLYIGSSGGYGVMKSWNISDGIGGSGDIKHGNQLTISGVSGINTQYDLANKLLRIGVTDSGHTIKLDNVITVPLSGITLTGEQVQNGVALSSGDRVLLVNQTDARENGIWEVGADPYGSWTRPTDFPSSGEASARWTHVQFGTHYDESVWFCVNNYPTTIDHDTQEWRYFDGGAGASGWANARDLAISGWADTTISNRDTIISGWADETMSNRDAALSGWVSNVFSSQVISAGSGLSLYDDQLSLNIDNLYEATDNSSNDFIANYSDTSGNKKISRNTFIRPGYGSLTDSATVTIDLSSSNKHYDVTLHGNRTLNVVNGTDGDRFGIKLIQDASGSKTVTWFDTINWPNAIEPTLTPSGGRADYFEFIRNNTSSYDNINHTTNLTTYSGGMVYLSESAVAYWTLDETTGTRADSVASYDLSESGVLDYTTSGKIGNAAKFHADSGAALLYSAASGSPFYPNNTSFSISLWARFDNISPVIKPIFDIDNLYRAYQANGNLRFACLPPEPASAQTLLFADTLSSDTDYFIVYTHDAENDLMKITVNASGTSSSVYTSGIRDGGPYPKYFRVGDFYNSTNKYAGYIDEVAFWNKALTDDDIQNLYNAGTGITYPFTGF